MKIEFSLAPFDFIKLEHWVYISTLIHRIKSDIPFIKSIDLSYAGAGHSSIQISVSVLMNDKTVVGGTAFVFSEKSPGDTDSQRLEKDIAKIKTAIINNTENVIGRLQRALTIVSTDRK